MQEVKEKEELQKKNLKESCCIFFKGMLSVFKKNKDFNVFSLEIYNKEMNREFKNYLRERNLNKYRAALIFILVHFIANIPSIF